LGFLIFFVVFFPHCFFPVQMFLLLVSVLLALGLGEDVQVAAARGLIRRVVPEHARFFQLSLLPAGSFDAWEVETHNGTVELRGTSGVALASAFNWYLKYKCNSVYLWQEQSLALPTPLPEVSPKQAQNSSFAYRYVNDCYLFCLFNIV
jgi:alpha-N-acetylglucosaminidase